MKFFSGADQLSELYIEGNYFVSTWTSGGSIGETLSVWTPGRSGCYKVIIYGGGELGTDRYGADLESFFSFNLNSHRVIRYQNGYCKNTYNSSGADWYYIDIE